MEFIQVQKIDRCIRVSGTTISLKDKVHVFGQMEEVTREIGKII